MNLDRRDLIAATTLGGLVAACGDDQRSLAFGDLRSHDAWDGVRQRFALRGDTIDMSAMLLASHPREVSEAIERHRRELDRDTVGYLEANNERLTRASREAAARYLDVSTRQIALVDSTTMGVGLVYAGLALRPGDEILTTAHDYYVTHESIRLACERTGAIERRVALHGEHADVSAAEIVARLLAGVTRRTRIIGLTWVHSSTGLKLPLDGISAAVGDLNRDRDENDRILICVDGVHGFGVENAAFSNLGCDFLVAGCHKWLFGPRGTGIVAGSDAGWRRISASIPSFIDQVRFDAWLARRSPSNDVDGATFSPGGFKCYEHVWAMPEAFQLHEALGKDEVEARTHALAEQLKEGLAATPDIALATPRSNVLSAGIVSFNVDGRPTEAVVRRLRERRIIASAAPYAPPYVRLTPSIRNSPAEVEAVLREIRGVMA